MYFKSRNYSFAAVLILLISVSVRATPPYTENDLRDIAHAIASKPNGKALVLRNIERDHTGDNPHKSFFCTREIGKISTLIDMAVNAPTGYLFSPGRRLLIIKDFTLQEIASLSIAPCLGIDLTPHVGTGRIPTNRLALCFAIDDVLAAGKPWNPMKGVLLTGMPQREDIGISRFH